MKNLVSFLLMLILFSSNTMAQNKHSLYTAKYTKMGSSIQDTTTLGNFNQKATIAKKNALTTHTSLKDFDRVVKIDLAGLLKKELAFELEKPLKNYKSYVFRTGIKFHPKTNLKSGIYSTQFTKIHSSSRTNLFVVFSSSGSNSKFQGEARPFQTFRNDFIPQFSIPLNNSLRFYTKDNEKIKMYFEGTLLSSIHKGLRIIDTERSSVVSSTTNNSSWSPLSLLYSSSRSSTEVLYTQTRRVSDDVRISAGLAISSGLQFSIKEKTFMDLQFQVGSNFINGLEETFDYTNGKIYGKVKLMIGLGS